MPASLNEASLAVLSQILNEHEISASDNASTEENRGYFPKTTCEAAERLSKKDVCDTCLISELATSWAANKSGDECKTALEEESKNEHKALSANDSVVQCEKMFSLEADVIPTDYGNPTGNVNVWREDEEQQEMENGSPGTHTKDNANLISFEEAMAKQVQAGAISANASDVSTVDATNDVPTALVRCTRYSFNKNQHDSGAKYSEIENDDAAMKLENEFVESDKQNNKYSVDDDTDSEVTSFSKFRSNAAISRQHKTTDQLSFDTQNHHDDTSFSLLNELKRSFAVERNTDNSQPVPPLLKQVKEVIECTQRTVDEDVENETQRIHLEEKAINDEESNVEEQSSDVEEISKRRPQGFIPMHEEIISAISTLRHVSDLPKPNFEDTADGASVAYRCSRISQPKHIERIFENPATASAGCLSTTDAEDRDSSASTPMTFFDPRLEFERRIKLKKNLKPKLDAPVIVKDIKATEISLKRFSGLRSSHDVSSESGKKTTSTTVSLDKDTNEPHTRSDSADSDGYYDTVSC
uniref:BRCT domain-containing protein n=1 Tax=Ascaris lumbricoides TaxID=6252 RepID=A0A0M3I5P2_ASCLU